MKKVLSLAIAAALAAPLAAMADATVYGKVRVATDNVSLDAGFDDNEVDVDSWGMTDQASRLGVKGSEDLGDGLKAVYKMEFGVNVGGSFSSLSGRNAYVGLAGDFGTAVAGRHDTPLKMSTGKLDLFADTIADNDTGGNHTGLFVDRRVDGAIAYISPNMSGLTVAAAMVQTAETDDVANAYSVAGMYSNGPIYAALAYETLDSDLPGIADDDEAQLRFGVGLMDMEGFTVTALYETRESIAGVENNDTTVWQLSGAYKLGSGSVKAMYAHGEEDNANGELDAWAVGYQHMLSKRTDAWIVYTDRDASDRIDGTNVDAGASGFSLQLNHSF